MFKWWMICRLARTDKSPVAIRKWPVTVTPRELVSMGAPDPPVGGFGLVFALEAIVAVLAAGVALVLRRGRGLLDPAFVLALGLAAISAAFPEPWSARYVPFFWMVPIFLVLGFLVPALASNGASRRWAAWCSPWRWRWRMARSPSPGIGRGPRAAMIGSARFSASSWRSRPRS